MYRLSLIISEIYNKYLPLAEQNGIVLNLDVTDPTKQISDPEQIKSFLDQQLSSTLQRSDKGQVTIGVDKESITITDSETTLSHAACRLLSNRHIEVTSRVGFGTTVKIFFQARPLPEPATEPAKPKLETVAAGIAIDNSDSAPSVQSETKATLSQNHRKIGLGAKLKLTGRKTTTQSRTNTTSTKKVAPKPKAQAKSSAKPTKKLQKTQRQLAAAAKKADREVKRIAKKASKATPKVVKVTAKKSRQTAKSASTTKKPARRTVRKLKLS